MKVVCFPKKACRSADIRELQRHFKAQGVAILNETAAGTSSPASFMIMDPDGTPILLDQHV